MDGDFPDNLIATHERLRVEAEAAQEACLARWLPLVGLSVLLLCCAFCGISYIALLHNYEAKRIQAELRDELKDGALPPSRRQARAPTFRALAEALRHV